MEEWKEKHRQKECKKGFYDFLQSLLPSLQAGYSLENACTAACHEVRALHGKDHPFVLQLESMLHGIDIHIPIDQLFYELATNTGDDDIRQFAIILEILKNMGGNTLEILRYSMTKIQKKMELAQEIQTILSGKIYEKNLMLLMPFFMVIYLRISNPIYLDTLYSTIPGKILMTISLAGIMGCFWWGEKIMEVVHRG